tara:strand:- start:229 stop:507 length:279 start_codon:yes stop_codon:yes gene_type:complete
MYIKNNLAIEPTYWDSLSQGKYSKFADAVMDVGPSPCQFHKCPRIEKCAKEAVECFAFRIWVNGGEKYLTEKNKKGEIKCLNKMQTRMEPIK